MLVEEKYELWDYCPEQFEEESFLSWFTRLAKENCSDTRLLYQRIRPYSSIKNIKFNVLEKELESIQNNSKNRDALIDALTPFHNIKREEFEIMQISFSGKNGFLSIPLIHPRYCPYCLKEDSDPYFRKNWFIRPFTICSKHKCLLLDSCPNCYSPIHFWNTNWDEKIDICPKCHNRISEDVSEIFHIHDLDYYQYVEDVIQKGIFNNIPIELGYFFNQLWELILHEDSIIKRLFDNHLRIPIEMLHRAIIRCSKIFINNPERIETIIEKKDMEHTSHPVSIGDLDNYIDSLPNVLNKEKIKERYLIIHPLLNMRMRTAQDVQEQAKNTGYFQRSLYRWMKLYREQGIVGLDSYNKQAGRRRKPFSDEIKMYLEEYIHKYILGNEDLTIKKITQLCIEKAKKLGLDVTGISYNTVRRRIIEIKEKLQNL